MLCNKQFSWTTEKAVSCANCGRSLGIRRVRSARHRRKTSPRLGPRRKLQLEDLKDVVILIGVYFLLAYSLYDLGAYIYDAVAS
jgi:hypothetical protein